MNRSNYLNLQNKHRGKGKFGEWCEQGIEDGGIIQNLNSNPTKITK